MILLLSEVVVNFPGRMRDTTQRLLIPFPFAELGAASLVFGSTIEQQLGYFPYSICNFQVLDGQIMTLRIGFVGIPKQRSDSARRGDVLRPQIETDARLRGILAER